MNSLSYDEGDIKRMQEIFLEKKKKLKNKPHDVTECFIICICDRLVVYFLLFLIFYLMLSNS